MRKTRLKKTVNPKHKRSFEFRTCDDSNGPVDYLRINREIIPGSVKGFDMIKAVKPYNSATADGVVFSPQAGITDVNSIITASDVIYELFTTVNPSLISELSEKYNDISAVNGAITSSLRYGDILLLVTAKEAKQTFEMVKTVFVRLFNFVLDIYKAVKDLNPKQAYEILSNAWLEYRYGWRPLYGEITTLYEKLSDRTIFDIQSAYGTEKYDGLNEEFVCVTTHNVLGSSKVLTSRIQISEISHKAGFNYYNDVDSRNADLAETLGLSMRSIVSTAHELVPFSFVLDMFVNLGDYIKTLDFEQFVKPVNGYKSTRFAGKVFTTLSEGINTSGNYWKHHVDERDFAVNELSYELFHSRDGILFPTYDWNLFPRSNSNWSSLTPGFAVGRQINSYLDYVKDISNIRAYKVENVQNNFTFVHAPGVLDKYRVENFGDDQLPESYAESGIFGCHRLVRDNSSEPFEPIDYLDKDSMVFIYGSSLLGFRDYKSIKDPSTGEFKKFVIHVPFTDDFIDHVFGVPIDIDYHCNAIESLYVQYVNGEIPTVDPTPWMKERFDSLGYSYDNDFQASPIVRSFWDIVVEAGFCTLGFEQSLTDGLKRSKDWALLKDCTFRLPYPFKNLEDFRPFLNFNSNANSEPLDFEFITRRPHDSFEFELKAEIDLDYGQIADLSIFAERLATGIRKRYL